MKKHPPKEGARLQLSSTPGRTVEPPSERSTRVFLTGFMGSGKSTIGPILANSLGWSFLDLDEAVEAADGRSITRIFREDGEERFREIEAGLLRDVCGKVRYVVALGGGTVAREENLRLVSAAGVLVYLRIDRERLMSRLRNKARRPLLAGSGSDDIAATVDALFREREPYYARADLVIDSGEQPLGETVDRLVRTLTPLIRP